jgi:hypothetical protein
MRSLSGIRCPYCGQSPVHIDRDRFPTSVYVCKDGCGGVFDEADLREAWRLPQHTDGFETGETR